MSRKDKRFCSVRCRVRAHRKTTKAKSQKEANGQPPEPHLPNEQIELQKAKLNEEMEQKQADLKAEQAALSDLKVLDEKLLAAIATYEKQLPSWKTKSRGFKKEIDSLENRIRILNEGSQKIDPNKPTVINLLSGLTEVGKAIQLPSLQKELSEFRDHLKNAQQNINSLNTRLAELKGKQSQISDAMEQKKKECASLDAEIGRLADQVAPKD